jgi:hypothetical protein
MGQLLDLLELGDEIRILVHDCVILASCCALVR